MEGQTGNLTHQYEVDCWFQRGVKALLIPAHPVYFLTNRLRCISTCTAVPFTVVCLLSVKSDKSIDCQETNSFTHWQILQITFLWASEQAEAVEDSESLKKHPKVLILSRFVPATFTVGHPSCSGNHSIQIIYTVCRGAIIEMRWSNGPR